MDAEYFLLVAREGLYLALLLSAPPVLAVLLVGAVGSVLQAVTQLQDHTIGFVPKLIAAGLALAVAGPLIGEQLVTFTQVIFEGIPAVGP